MGQQGHGIGARPWRVRAHDLVIGVVVLVVLLVGGAALAPIARDAPVVVESRFSPVAYQPTDDFDRADPAAGLGTTAEGGRWTEVAGAWGIDGGSLRLEVPDPVGRRNLVVFDMGAADGTVAARARVAAGGTGLVFRYASPSDFWQVVPAPAFGTWVLQHLVDGRIERNEDLFVIGVQDGTVVQVVLTGSQIEVQVGDHEPATYDDPAGAGRTFVGFSALGAESLRGRWDDFLAAPSGSGG